jgi:hypothetical protein
MWLKVRLAEDYVPVAKKAQWLQKKLRSEEFNEWINTNHIDKDAYLSLEFAAIEPQCGENEFCLLIKWDKHSPFTRLVLKQEFYRYFRQRGCFIYTSPMVGDIEAFQNMGAYEKLQGYNRYRAISFLYKPEREELILQITGNRILFSRDETNVEVNQSFINTRTGLYQKAKENTAGLAKYAEKLQEAPERFDYKKCYQALKEIAEELSGNFRSPFFETPESRFLEVSVHDTYTVSHTTNQMVFAHEQKHVNAAMGMREFGPYKKAKDADKTELIFIYQNNDHANKLYQYLKNGLRQFPGLMSYVGIPVALADKSEQLKYSNPENLSEELKNHIADKLTEKEYKNKLAIVIGPFKKYESDEEERELYYQVKKQLLEKGIPSQFVSPQTLLSQSFHFALPNIAIAILAKLGGIPWKLDSKKTNELVVGFNSRKLADTLYIGNAVFFDNEGKLGGVNGFHAENHEGIVEGLQYAINSYQQAHGNPERMIIHHYKTASKKEIKALDELLQNLSLNIPYAIVEVNDSKSKLDICFDMDFQFLMPKSGTYVEVGEDEYLLFNNARYSDNVTSLREQELPVKLKISYMSSEAFNKHELISQVYEFSRINWKGLKQKSLPATITFSKMIADFAAHFNGEIPQTIAAQQRPWFL